MKMRKILIPTILVALVFMGCGSSSPTVPAWPPDQPVRLQAPDADQDTVDWITFLLMQPFQFDWNPDDFGYDNLWGSLESILASALDDGNNVLAESAIHAMGESGMIEFLPTIVDALAYAPVSAGYALRNMESEYAVFILIEKLDNPEIFVRAAAVGSIGQWKWYDSYPVARENAVNALSFRLGVEPVTWVREDIINAIVSIQGGEEF